MQRSALFLFTAVLSSFSALASECGAPPMLEKLRAAEWAFQRDKFPPAFRHAVEEGAVDLRMTKAETRGDKCLVLLEESLPAADVRQAAEIIDAQPARRIMLLSQGYAIPETPHLRAEFSVDPATLAVSHSDTLQVAELGKLRATIEMVYATLSQARAEVNEASQNSSPWSAGLRQRAMEACRGQVAAEDAAERCRCQADKLEARLSERQLDHVAYVKENPYAYATGVLKGYEALLDEIRRACRQGK